MSNNITEKRGNLYSYDPADLCIVGGKTLPADQQGPNDTDVDPADPLHDERVALTMEEPFILNIDAFGVKTPITVVKRNGIPTVVVGRQRVRAARLVNVRRAKTGQPLIRIDAVLESSRTDGTRLMGAMIAENAGRRDDDFATTVAKLRRYMERGVSIEDAAVTANMKTNQAKAWLKFDETAIPEVRDAVVSGKLSVSAGMEIARGAKSPELQAKALAATLEASAAGNGKATTNAARTAAKKAVKGDDVVVGVHDRRTQKKLLQAVADKDLKNAGERTIAFWEGVENALMLVLGDAEADKRLVELLAKVRKDS